MIPAPPGSPVSESPNIVSTKLENETVWRLPASEGVIVRKVSENSPADEAGIRKDDVIIRFGDTQIKAVKELTRIVAATKPGTKVNVTILRGKEKQSVSVKIGKKNP